MFGALWSVVTLPFRLVAGLVELFGRLIALLLGFGLMVFGVALLAGPGIVLGLPVFAVGLLVTVRSLR